MSDGITIHGGTCGMDRLSGLDASFLYLETPAQLMHVCGLIIVDPSTCLLYTSDAADE